MFSKANLLKAIKDPGYAFKRGSAIVASGLYTVLRPFHATAPQTLTLYLTHRCNQRCVMCGIWGKSASDKDGDRLGQTLAPADYEKLLSQFSLLKPSVCLFGGEPLLYPHLDELLTILVKKKFRSHMISNGLALSEKASLLAQRLDRLTISINGTAAVHDEIVQVPGAFEKTMTGIRKLQEINKASGRPLVYMLVTITKENHDKLIDIVDQAQELALDGITIQHLSYIEQEGHKRQCEMLDKFRPGAADFAKGFVREDSGIDPNRLWDELQNILNRKTRTPVFQYPDFTREECMAYYSPDAFQTFELRRCTSPYHEVTIMPDGSVTPCMELSMGNILETPFKEIWNNQNMIRFRKQISENTFPYCVRCCGLYRY